jgi:nitrite reductase/ring-hydroxylating ferredoxin subunit
MPQERSPSSGPDLTQGVTLAEFLDGKLAGHVGDQKVLLVHNATGIFAVAAHCSHYHGPLAEGLVVGTSIRCPWHHACFNLRSGEAVRAPAINSLACWQVEQRNGRVFIHEKREQRKPSGKALARAPDRVVIVGGGAAVVAAAEMFRRGISRQHLYAE